MKKKGDMPKIDRLKIESTSKCLSNKKKSQLRFNRLEEETTNQRVSIIRQKQSSTPNKAQRLTTKQKLYVKFNHLTKAQQQRLTIHDRRTTTRLNHYGQKLTTSQ